MFKFSRLVVLGVSAIALHQSGAQSKTPQKPAGIFAGVELSPFLISTDKYISDTSARTSAAMGVGAQVGLRSRLGIGPFVRLEGAFAPRQSGSYRVLNFNYGLRWSVVPLQGALHGRIPYVEVAVNNRIISQNNVKVEGRTYSNGSEEAPFPKVSSGGIAMLVGAGLEFHVREKALLNMGISRTKGRFNSIRFGGSPVDGWDFDGTDYRLHVGIQWLRGAP